MSTSYESPSKRGFARLRSFIRRRWPNLYASNLLLRYLLHEPLFAIVLLLMVLGVLSVALMLPKRWDPAPAGFSKNIRISLLDYLQAWSLRRSAEKSIRAQEWDEAITKYQAAIANNLADVKALRGLLGTLRDTPFPRPSNLGLSMGVANLLFELDHTNRTDSALVADVLERHRMAEMAINQLTPHARDLTPEEDIIWTRALFSSGQLEPFRSRWKEHPERYQSNAVLRLYRAAHDYGWGTPEQAVTGLEILHAALDQPTHRPTAARLLCAAAHQKGNLTEYERSLKIQHEARTSTAQDDTAWWELLSRNGRTEEARELARTFEGVPPATAVEFVILARAWLNLGLQDLAAEKFKAHAQRFGNSIEVWAAYLDILLLRKDWNEVRRVTSTLRATTTSRDELQSVALYADIRADLAEGRKTSVREPLRKLLEAPLPGPRISLKLASGLNSVGEYEAAWHFLGAFQESMAQSPEFWMEVVTSSRGRRDPTTLRQAAERLVVLKPGNPAFQTLRLVALLGSRQLPGEALTTSLRLFNAAPRAASTTINHSMALLLNSRATEALTLLSTLDSDKLNEDELNSWNLAQADAHAQLDQPAEALRFGEQVNPANLMMPQAEWFKKLLAECRRRSAKAPTKQP